jgi:hypothetical protein
MVFFLHTLRPKPCMHFWSLRCLLHAHSSWSYPNNIEWKVQIMKFLFVQFSPTTYFLYDNFSQSQSHIATDDQSVSESWFRAKIPIINVTVNKKFSEELIAYFPLISLAPRRKRGVQQLFYCCVCIYCHGNVFTKPLPSKDKGYTHRHRARRSHKPTFIILKIAKGC